MKEMTLKAQKAYLYALAKSIIADLCNLKVGLHLFDYLTYMIKPIALYGCELWGAYLKEWNKDNFTSKLFENNSYPFEKLHVKCCKLLLGLNRRTSNFAAKCELGRIPLILNIQAIVRLVLSTLNKSPDSLIHKAVICQIKGGLTQSYDKL